MNFFVQLVGAFHFFISITGFVPDKDCKNPAVVAVKLNKIEKGVKGTNVSIIVRCTQGTEVRYDVISIEKPSKLGL